MGNARGITAHFCFQSALNFRRMRTKSIEHSRFATGKKCSGSENLGVFHVFVYFGIWVREKVLNFWFLVEN
jgi:hypothetical protein